MYFDNFPKLLYDFDLKEGPQYSVEGPKYQLVTDITRNIRFKKEFMDQINFYEVYRINDGESIEEISEKIYGTPQYHWALMLLNQRYDYAEDFPVSGYLLDEIVEKKYGSRRNDAHHFVNDDGLIVEPVLTIGLTNPVPNSSFPDITLFDAMKVGNVIRRKTAVGDYIGRIESVNKTTKKITALVTTGSFAVQDPVQIYKYYDNAQGQFVEELVGTATVTSIDYPVNVTEVTNYEYEYFENEKKRMLRIIPQQYMQQIITEFETLMRDGQ